MTGVNEKSQNTVLLPSTQAVYKAPHSTVQWGRGGAALERETVHMAAAVGSLRA